MNSLPPALMGHLTANRHRPFLANYEPYDSEHFGNYLKEFVKQERAAMPAFLVEERVKMPPELEGFVVGAWQNLQSDLLAMPCMNEGPQTIEAMARGEAELKQLTARAAHILLAMRLSGIDEDAVTYTQGVLTRAIEETGLAWIIKSEAVRRGVDVRELATAAYAAVDSIRVPNIHPSPEASIRARKLPRSALGEGEVLRAARTIAAEAQRVDAMVSGTINLLTSRGRERLGLGEAKNADTVIRMGVVPLITTPPREEQDKINLKLLVGFLAVARGATADSWLFGALDLIRDVTALAQEIQGVRRPTWDTVVMDRTLDALEYLTQMAREERGVNRFIEEGWRQMEDLVKRGPTTKSGERLPMPLRKEEAPKARGMYYHNAVALGLPLSVLLAEIYDSDEISFGPTERNWFARIATYRARGYAANMAANECGVWAALREGEAGGNPVSAERIEAIRAIVRRIEVSLRLGGRGTDNELKEMAKVRLEYAIREGLMRSEVGILLSWPSRGGAPGLVEEMILRLRAEQEVRVISAYLATRQTVGADLLAQVKLLPHAKTFAERVDPEGTWFWSQRARNGETLLELERDTRGRWNRYSQEATAGRDVRAIVIPSVAAGSGEYNPLDKGFGPKPGAVPPKPGAFGPKPTAFADKPGPKW